MYELRNPVQHGQTVVSESGRARLRFDLNQDHPHSGWFALRVSPMEGRRAPKDAGLHAVQALLPLTRGEPVEPAGPGYFLNGSEYSLTLSLSSAMSAASCSLMYFAMVASLSPTVET